MEWIGVFVILGSFWAFLYAVHVNHTYKMIRLEIMRIKKEMTEIRKDIDKINKKF